MKKLNSILNVKFFTKSSLFLVLILCATSLSLVAQSSDLEITKTVNDATPNEGQEVEYKIAVKNLGPDKAEGISIQEVLPAGVTFVSADPSRGSYYSMTQLWDLGTLKDGEKKELNIKVTIDPGTSGDVITNTAFVYASDQLDTITANNSASIHLTVNTPDLKVTKEVNDDTADEGQEIEYTIRVKNEGDGTATGVVISDVLDAGLVYVSDDSGGDYDSGTGDWSVGTLEHGDEAELKITVAPRAGTNGSTITNTASVLAMDQSDSDMSNNSAYVDVTVNAPELSVTKQVDSDNTPSEGDNVRYKITVKNQGSGPATGVQVTDLLPAGVTYSAVESITSGQTYDDGSGVWDVGDVATGQTYELKIDATVNAGTSGQTITNSASVSALDQNDADASNDSASADITVNSPDLKVTKTVNDNTPDEGQNIEYTVKVKNEGTGAATGVVANDLLDAGLTYVSDSGDSLAYNSITGDWTIGAISPGQEVTLKITAAPGTGTNGSTISNTASVSAMDQPDSDMSNNSASVDVTVNQPELRVTKEVDGDNTPSEGDNVRYKITVKNQGSGPATGVQVTDLLPAGVTYSAVESITAGQTYDDGSGVWDVGDVATGQTYELKIDATVNAGTSGQTITNSASVSALDQNDADASNDSASADITVNSPDLKVTKTVNDNTPDEGQNIEYTVKVKNEGTGAATGVVANDLLDAGLTYVSDSGDSLAYNSITGDWTIGAISPGQEVTLKITAAPGTGTNGSTISNTASVSAMDQPDSDMSNNSASVDVTVNQPELRVTKEVDGDNTPSEGDNVRYKITVKNQGSGPATGVQVTDLLPAGVTYSAVESITAGQTYDDGSGVWDVGDVATGQTYELKIDATVNAGTSGQTITNSASVSALDQNDADASNDSASADITVNSPDLKVTKTVNDNTPDEGQNIEYTVKVKNEGDGTATGVVANDLLDTGLTYVSDSGDSLAYNSVTGDWTIGAIAPGQEVTLKITAAPGAGTNGSTITNTASVSAMDQPDSDMSNNSASVDVTVNAPDLKVTKQVDSDDTPAEGDNVRYKIEVKNEGSADATGVTIMDMLPAGVTFSAVESIPSGQSYDDGTGTWDVGDIDNGQSFTLKIDVTVDAGTGGSTITNTASVGALDQNDTDGSNNSSFADIVVDTVEAEVVVPEFNGVSFNGNSDAIEVSLFPNPTFGNLNIAFVANEDGAASVNIVSFTGKTVLTQDMMVTSGQNKLSIGLDQLSKGMYIVLIKTANNQITRTVILE